MYTATAPVTVNVQPLNVPVPVPVHALAAPIVPPAEIVKTIVAPGVNPLPEAVTVTPVNPCVGTSVTVGIVTVNVPVADCPPASVTVTVVPVVPLGTFNVQLNAPVAPVVNEPTVQLELATATPSKFSPTKLVTEKPVPDTVTATPAGPWAELRVIPSVVTVNGRTLDGVFVA